jgi:Raf kinase inhibitor-like YbhB/YbcL family protein
MGKFLGWLFIIFIIAAGGGYYYYTQTGYKFGLDDTFLFKGTIGISSQDFSDGGVIPSRYTCDGDEISPQFTLMRVPTDAKSLAFILEDVSVKPNPFTHWLVFNFKSDFNIIDSSLAWQNGLVGFNDFGNKEYNGPCPPIGETHKYYFRVYALNTNFANTPLSRAGFDKIISGHVLTTGSMVGMYTRVAQ